VQATVTVTAAPAPIDDDTLVALFDEHAPWRPLPLCPELSLWQADDELPLWQALEAHSGGRVGVPYFCVAWPAALVLARAVLDGEVDVRGRRVVDVGCGSGAVALACAKAGAASVRAVDVDAYAVAAARLAAARLGLALDVGVDDVLADPATVDDRDLILCADLVSQAPVALGLKRLVEHRGGRGCVLVDSGRPFFHPCGLPLVATTTAPARPGVDGQAQRTVKRYGL
jgi:predicted nicotinamide N-methyase